MRIEDMQENLWVLIETDGAKHHYCPRQLMNDLIVELERRFGETNIVKGVDEGFIDLPGMIMTDRPLRNIKIDTFTLTIPSQDFSYFLDTLEEAKVRTFSSGKKYYKLHGWLHCVVFMPEQYYMVLDAMRMMKDEAEEEAMAADGELGRRVSKMKKTKGKN